MDYQPINDFFDDLAFEVLRLDFLDEPLLFIPPVALPIAFAATPTTATVPIVVTAAEPMEDIASLIS